MKNTDFEQLLDGVIDANTVNIPREHKSDFARKMKTDPTYVMAINAMKAVYDITQVSKKQSSDEHRSLLIGVIRSELAWVDKKQAHFVTFEEECKIKAIKAQLLISLTNLINK